MSNQIAMVGNAGAGKTVLLTVLAHRLTHNEFSRVSFDSSNIGTSQYIAERWAILNGAVPPPRGQNEWGESNPAGTVVDLSWTLRVHGIKEPIPFNDLAGQDLALFPFKYLSADEVTSLNATDRAAYDKKIKIVDYVRQASIILVLVDLSKFIGEANPAQRAKNEMELKLALDDVIRLGQQNGVAFILPQWDKYDFTVKNNYDGSCRKFLKKELPQVYAAHIAGKLVKVFPVAAVADTIEEDRDGDGIDEKYPQPGFHSEGLEPLVRWLSRCVVPMTVRFCFWLSALIAFILSLLIGYFVYPYIGYTIGRSLWFIYEVCTRGFGLAVDSPVPLSGAVWKFWMIIGWGIGIPISLVLTVIGRECGKTVGKWLDTKLNRPVDLFAAWLYEKVSWIWNG